MKASAGSGKTFSLAREYIRLLLQRDSQGRCNPKAHRHILAVTFTNKATAEMKSRIIKELDTLAEHPEDSDYRDYLVEQNGFPDVQELSAAAGTSLREILRDYGSFSVSTIDSFFQKVLRSFAREAGQVNSYQIELDKPSLVAETADRVLDSLSEERADLLKWLSDNSVESLENGDGYHLSNLLSNFASNFLSETYSRKAALYGIDESEAFSEQNMTELKKICRETVRNFHPAFIKEAKRVHDVLKGFACYDDGVSKNLKKQLAKFESLSPSEVPDFSSATWRKAVTNASDAFVAAAKKKLCQQDYDALQKEFESLDAWAGEPLRTYKTAKLLLKQVTMFRVAEELRREFKALLAQKNVLSLDDSNAILHDIINGTDTPFIYEKTGVRYNHFLLDEFQDTSLVQWENFLPLLRSSVAEGCYNLIVGDVKQSIYRWRDAEWGILDSGVQRELERTVAHPLESNYRSAKQIVAFNNGFYDFLASHLDKELVRKTGREDDGRIRRIYADVAQKAEKKMSAEGYVQISFCDKEAIRDRAVAAVKEAHDSLGFDYKDIAVVVRTNELGGEVALELVKAGIRVVSNDSLKISSGRSVQKLVSRLFLLDNPEDKLNTYYAGDFDPAGVEKSRSLCDLAESVLRTIPAQEVNADTLYVLAFMDLLRDFCAREGNSLHAFLQFWKDRGCARKISSPEGGDAVTVITIHKVKGLDFPFVVLPIGSGSNSFEGIAGDSWEYADLEGTALGKVRKALYNVKLSSALSDTAFEQSYLREMQMKYIDSANTWYVATTRASQGMHIICSTPKLAGINSALYAYATLCNAEKEEEDSFIFGRKAAKVSDGGHKERVAQAPLEYFREDVSGIARGKIRIKSDWEDSEGSSQRRRGTILHKIMEDVATPSDLGEAVRKAVLSGMLDPLTAEREEAFLSAAIGSVRERGWFPDDASRIVRERDILSSEGEVYRPDRVILCPEGGRVVIVDYKFGEKNPSYARQLKRYMRLYREMGYAHPEGYLWYVTDGTVEKVQE